MENKFVEAGKKYVSLGWKLVPLNGKKPVWNDWPNKGISTPEEVEEVWGCSVGLNVGAITGEESGFITLDIDAEKGGFESLKILQERFGLLPETVTATTGSGGKHIDLRYPKGNGKKYKNAVGLLGFKGIDVRADGGVIVLPPSVHPNGKPYTWAEGHSPDEIEMADAPEWLLDAIEDKPQNPKQSVVKKSGKIEEGKRNDYLASIAGTMRRKGNSEEEIEAALLKVNKTTCNPPLDESEVAQVAKSIAKYDSTEEDTEEKQQEVPNKKVVAALIEIGLKTGLFHDENKDAYTVVNIDGVDKILCLRRSEFKHWLGHQYYKLTDNGAGRESINSAINTLTGISIFECQQHPLSVRFAQGGEDFWIDLVNEKYQAIKVSATEWMVEKPPILFKRFNHMKELPTPNPEGNALLLLNFINVKRREDQLLLMVWMIVALLPNIAKSILTINGVQGSGKSCACKFIKELIDPSIVPLLVLPKDERELALILDHHALPIFDNQTGISKEVASLLCMGATGGALTKRQLYTDDDTITLELRRPIILNGINTPTDAADFADRTIAIELERITPTNRRTEREMEKEFEAQKPFIFGGMLNTLVKAINVVPKTGELSRMADFALWATKVALALGYSEEEFIKAMADNSEIRRSEVLGNNPIVNEIETLLHLDGVPSWKKESFWEGSAVELLEELSSRRSDKPNKYDQWPKNASYLAKKLRELKPMLLDIGIEVLFLRTHNEGRRILLRKVSKDSSPVSRDTQ